MFAHARRLRWSGEELGYPIDLRGLVDTSVELGVPGGKDLIDLVDSFVQGKGTEAARSDVRSELGDASFVDAAGCFGNFEMMNRIAEGTGIPVPKQAVEREADMMKTLGLYDILKSQQL